MQDGGGTYTLTFKKALFSISLRNQVDTRNLEFALATTAKSLIVFLAAHLSDGLLSIVFLQNGNL
jgi:hypothetical protein